MSLVERVRACRRHDTSGLVPLVLGVRRLGWARPAVADLLARDGSAFRPRGRALRMRADLDTPARRTRRVAAVVGRLKDAGLLAGWWGEAAPVKRRWEEGTWFDVERAALDALGLPAFGVHLNGWVRSPEGVRVWVARRARDRQSFAGQLDHLAAGGQPSGLSLAENMRKEAAEEAGVPDDLLDGMRPAGGIAYRCLLPEGLNDDTIYVYDLELPESFVPRSADGEVEAFEAWSVPEVLARLRDGEEFKFNVGPVVLDFLLRHDLLPADEPERPALERALRPMRRPHPL
jgi:hypothetical protein